MPNAPFPLRGEIRLVEFPDDAKSRPALIVSPNVRNQYANSILAVPITTNLKPLPTHVLMPAGQGAWIANPWRDARMSHTSTKRGCAARDSAE